MILTPLKGRPLFSWFLNLITQQQQLIENQAEKIAKLEQKVRNLDEELKVAKKLKAKPKIRPSILNDSEQKPKVGEKRAGSEKRSKKLSFVVDEKRIIEPEEIPEPATNNCYREYDVQEIVLKRQNIRLKLG